jgi:uncharacterized protein (DUF58 family)
MRPTTRGIGTVAAGAALVAAGYLFGYPDLLIVGVTALLAAGCAVLYAALRPRLSVRRSVDPDRVTRGEPCEQTLTIGNASRWRAATLVAQDRCGAGRIPVPLVRLRPAQDSQVRYPVPTARRGVVDVGPLTVERRDPLGLVRLSRTHGGTARVWVHPRWYPMAATPTGVTRSLDGRVDRVPHGSITFDKLRQYVIGDELRHVHWRTTARVGELMVREHVDTSLPRLVVLLDDRSAAYGDPECFEAACEAAASVIAAATRDDLPIELLLVCGDRATAAAGDPGGAAMFAGGRRTSHSAPLLDRLAEATLARAGQSPGRPTTGHQAGDTGHAADPEAAVLADAVNRLRQFRLGDTLAYLTGDGRTADLASVGGLHRSYPSIVAGVFGDPQLAPQAVEGLQVLAVPDAASFAAAWDGVGRW